MSDTPEQAPQGDGAGPGEAGNTTATHGSDMMRPLMPLAKPLRLFLRIYAGAGSVAVISYLLTIGFLTLAFDGALSQAQIEALGLPLDLLTLASLVVYLVAFIVCVVLTCRWTYRAANNLTLVGRDGDTSPRMAVIWYFIPFANLWMPFKATQEIWQGSLGGEARTGLLGFWWACWIIGSLVSNGTTRVFGLDPDVEVLRLSLAFDAASTAILVVSALAFGRIVTRVAKAQDDGFSGAMLEVFR